MKKNKRPEYLRHLGGHCNRTHLDEGVLNYMIDKFHVKSFLDIGCGPGGMVELALSKNLDCLGIDGDPLVERNIDKNFVLHDFCQTSYTANKKFDLVWSCEFVEHVEEIYQQNYLKTFELGQHVVLTFAPPGTPGYHHVNCQPFEYWIEVFNKAGFFYDKNITEEIRSASTMRRNFIRSNGLYFVNQNR